MHHIPSHLLEETVDIALVGCGGNGAQMLSGLARLDRALLAIGHPGGLNVEVYDPDRVSESNVGRQLYYPSDIGLHKATVLTHRLNLAYGLHWKSSATRFPEGRDRYRMPHIVISCVDSAAARRQINKSFTAPHSPDYWLDLGNQQHIGQAIIGQPFLDVTFATVMSREEFDGDFKRGTAEAKKRIKQAQQQAERLRLRTVMELHPELLNVKLKEDTAPSCSLAESLEKQDLFINDHVSRWALHLLWRLFRHGGIEHHGYYINLQSGRVNPIPVPSPPVEPQPTAKPKRTRRAA